MDMKKRTTLALTLAGLVGSVTWSPVGYACAYEPLLSSVCIMAASGLGSSFNNTSFVAADGRLLNVAQNAALFALVGTTYGGDGRTTFGIPDLRGRVAIGSGTVPYGTFKSGQQGGVNQVVLTSAQMPIHLHALVNAAVDTSKLTATTTLTGLSASVTGSLTLKASSAMGNQGDPTNNYLGKTALGTNKIYADSAPSTVSLNSASIDASGLKVGNFTGTPATSIGGTATISANTTNAGGSGPNVLPVPTMMPYTVLNYYVAVQGIFPTKD